MKKVQETFESVLVECWKKQKPEVYFLMESKNFILKEFTHLRITDIEVSIINCFLNFFFKKKFFSPSPIVVSYMKYAISTEFIPSHSYLSTFFHFFFPTKILTSKTTSKTTSTIKKDNDVEMPTSNVKEDKDIPMKDSQSLLNENDLLKCQEELFMKPDIFRILFLDFVGDFLMDVKFRDSQHFFIKEKAIYWKQVTFNENDEKNFSRGDKKNFGSYEIFQHKKRNEEYNNKTILISVLKSFLIINNFLVFYADEKLENENLEEFEEYHEFEGEDEEMREKKKFQRGHLEENFYLSLKIISLLAGSNRIKIFLRILRFEDSVLFAQIVKTFRNVKKSLTNRRSEGWFKMESMDIVKEVIDKINDLFVINKDECREKKVENVMEVDNKKGIIPSLQLQENTPNLKAQWERNQAIGIVLTLVVEEEMLTFDIFCTQKTFLKLNLIRKFKHLEIEDFFSIFLQGGIKRILHYREKKDNHLIYLWERFLSVKLVYILEIMLEEEQKERNEILLFEDTIEDMVSKLLSKLSSINDSTSSSSMDFSDDLNVSSKYTYELTQKFIMICLNQFLSFEICTKDQITLHFMDFEEQELYTKVKKFTENKDVRMLMFPNGADFDNVFFEKVFLFKHKKFDKFEEERKKYDNGIFRKNVFFNSIQNVMNLCIFFNQKPEKMEVFHMFGILPDFLIVLLSSLENGSSRLQYFEIIFATIVVILERFTFDAVEVNLSFFREMLFRLIKRKELHEWFEGYIRKSRMCKMTEKTLTYFRYVVSHVNGGKNSDVKDFLKRADPILLLYSSRTIVTMVMKKLESNQINLEKAQAICKQFINFGLLTQIGFFNALERHYQFLKNFPEKGGPLAKNLYLHLKAKRQRKFFPISIWFFNVMKLVKYRMEEDESKSVKSEAYECMRFSRLFLGRNFQKHMNVKFLKIESMYNNHEISDLLCYAQLAKKLGEKDTLVYIFSFKLRTELNFFAKKFSTKQSVKVLFLDDPERTRKVYLEIVSVVMQRSFESFLFEIIPSFFMTFDDKIVNFFKKELPRITIQMLIFNSGETKLIEKFFKFLVDVLKFNKSDDLHAYAMKVWIKITHNIPFFLRKLKINMDIANVLLKYNFQNCAIFLFDLEDKDQREKCLKYSNYLVKEINE